VLCFSISPFTDSSSFNSSIDIGMNLIIFPYL
jgi:hypothetical protein